MRLICPNCDAQYEVDANVIPMTGRDVQCSNCGHTWFQRNADLPPASPSETSTPKPVEAQPKDTTSAQPTIGDGDHESGESIAKSRPTPQSSTPNTGLTDSVRDILRSEAEFDQNMRETGTDEPKAQPAPEPTTSEPELTRQSLRERMARLHNMDPADEGLDATAAAATLSKRRDLLPDIEEIKSSLNPAPNQIIDDETDDVPEIVQKSRFRATFFTLVICTFVLVGLYVGAPLLAKKFPALQPTLDVYVSAANSFRAWLGQAMEAASEKINALLHQLNEKT